MSQPLDFPKNSRGWDIFLECPHGIIPPSNKHNCLFAYYGGVCVGCNNKVVPGQTIYYCDRCHQGKFMVCNL